MGAMVNVSLEAAKQLKREGVEPEVIDLRTLKPLDKDTILSSVKRTGRAVIVEESHRISGFASDIAAIIGEAGLTLADIIRINAYVTAREHMQGYMAVRDRVVGTPPPASTLMIVSGFTRPEFLVEIEAVAATVDQPA